MTDYTIVFIADRISSHSKATLFSADLEKLNDIYFNDVYNALKSIGKKVVYFNSPKEFLTSINLHSNDVVLSLWSGEDSKNRRALVPSICEAYNIAYVGADSYLQLISQDKQLSKSIIRRYGLKYPKSVLIQSKNDIALVLSLSLPIIVKPNFEGGSIGIFAQNLVYNYEDARLVINELLKRFTPLIIEEFIPGEEISVCIAGIDEENIICHAVRQYIGNKKYLDKEIFSAEIKKINNNERHRDIVTKTFPSHILNQIKSMYFSFSKAEVMRVDGRFNYEGFFVIELTADCSLSQSSSINLSFKEDGYNYKEMFSFLVNNAITNHKKKIQNATL